MSGQKPRRLMVIDDNKDAAESMSMRFELWGHQVLCAYDGRAAQEAAAKYRPEAVFLDIGLPGMDGYEVAERLRELPESARAVLVAITGYGQDEDRRRSREVGIDHHLVKPVAPETLHNLLDTLAQGWRRAARLQTTRNSRTLNALGGADSQRAQTLRRCCADRNPDFAAIRSRSNLLWVTSSFAKAKRISCT